MISGFTSSTMTWMGAGALLRQMDSMLAFIESGGHALLLEYEKLVHDKRKTIRRILKMLELDISSKRVKEVIEYTDKDRMRDRLNEQGHAAHITEREHALGREAFSPYHREMIDRIVLTDAPMLPDRLASMGMDYIIRLENEEGRGGIKTVAKGISSWLGGKGGNNSE
jgi:hypothetical protein